MFAVRVVLPSLLLLLLLVSNNFRPFPSQTVEAHVRGAGVSTTASLDATIRARFDCSMSSTCLKQRWIHGHSWVKANEGRLSFHPSGLQLNRLETNISTSISNTYEI